MKSRPILIVTILLVVVVAAALLLRRGSRLPEPGSDRYEQVTRAFYHGLSALEVGLLDDARMQFGRATELVEEEPASWANLGVAQLRLGELDAAAEPVARALSLAPDNVGVLLVAARMEIARGQLDEGIAYLRRAAELDDEGLRTRFALAEEVERAGAPNADSDALALLDELVERAPANAAILLERARLAAKAGDVERLNDSIDRIRPLVASWPASVGEQFRALQDAAAASNFALAGRSTILMRNLLAAVPSFRESLVLVRTPTELVAEPLETFVRLAPASSMPSPADPGLAYSTEVIDPARARYAVAVSLDMEGRPGVFAAGESSLRRLDGPGGEWPLPGPATAIASIDWNGDFRSDLVVADSTGVFLMLQDENGTFETAASIVCDCTAVWAADIEMDGDLDVIAGTPAGPMLLRNNGDGTWMQQPMFVEVANPRAFAWADLDGDADPDAAFLDASGNLYVYINRQAGDFVLSNAAATGLWALTAADTDGDGRVELLVLEEGGAVRRMSHTGDEWSSQPVLTWEGIEGDGAGSFRLFAADLDNSGAIDIVASGFRRSMTWLSDEQRQFTPLTQVPEGEVTSIVDFDGDGHLDLLAMTETSVVRHLGRGTANYHWKTIRPRATTTTGDQRINSFGVGGEIQVRSGLLTQTQLLTGGPVHVGLGDRTAIDVARIVWPNGVAQAEFGIGVDDELVAEQRLKGSCPWVFAWDGTKMAFVTDFLWRSPLGLRINAQDTAGVVQTEDWVRIDGAQLAARDAAYDIRITAELWETHFFDHVSLMVVDHPADTEIFVDERFSAARPPAYAVHAVRDLQPVTAARDHKGRDVTDLVAGRDGRYLATFERGRYQGIAEDHFVEFDGPQLWRGQPGERLLIASGWIYPTDSSINVAIGQGTRVRPRGLSLEAQGADGRWRAIEPDLGFPAGKNKHLVIDLSRAGNARRLRLRTNLEIYWDSLALAYAADAPIETTRLPASSAELRYRGFSETSSLRDESPETPDYGRLANRTQRWRDLEGYHTRFGDVKELLEAVDDRYVIMNAGDEMQLRFAEQPPARTGWRRDFVLIGDGWEKDGDYNTGFSQTVLPLPSHDTPNYGAEIRSTRSARSPLDAARGDPEPVEGSGQASLVLEDDPVYQRHRADWETYHTRYVTPAGFVRGLR